MMWTSSPAYFAVVLIKVIWTGGVYSDSGDTLSNPVAHVSSVLEISMDQCKKDGAKWELDAGVAVVSGKDDLDVNNGAWSCKIVATGGLEAEYENNN